MKRIGVIGYGRRISGILERIVEGSGGEITVEAVHDVSADAIEQAKEQYPDIRVYDSVDELVTQADLDWIFIGSFNAMHRDHALAAINADKHVFCEKPLATTKQDSLDMLAARRKHPDKEFVVGFVLRYSLFYNTMKSWIDEGRLGDLISMELNETLTPQHGAAMQGNWRRKRELSGPMVLEKCCHDIDLLLWLTGTRPARIASFGGRDFFTADNAHYNDLSPSSRVVGIGLLRSMQSTMSRAIGSSAAP